jgi:hypothetical protein
MFLEPPNDYCCQIWSCQHDFKPGLTQFYVWNYHHEDIGRHRQQVKWHIKTNMTYYDINERVCKYHLLDIINLPLRGRLRVYKIIRRMFLLY